jgi:hypothetical protein
VTETHTNDDLDAIVMEFDARHGERMLDAVPESPSSIHRLHRGHSKKPILEIVPDSTGLYRIAWPDIGLSETANLTRCKQAALEWAEQRFLTENRKMNGARRLKSLNNFWWSTAPMRQNRQDAPRLHSGVRKQ